MKICNKEVEVGDYVKVEYTEGTWSKGGTIKGKITKIWDDLDYTLAQVENGWCFHDNDIILEHKKGEKDA